MKAKELMIGDKIQITHVETNLESQRGVYATVCMIEEQGNYWRINVVPDNSKNDYFIEREEEFEPIPLTQEILEKNGWQQDYSLSSYHKDFGDEYIALRTGCDGKNSFWWVVAGVLVCPINYVHELQHELRLCKIEKEIII